MNILVPINSKYLVERYNMSDSLISRIENEVVSNTVNRLAADSRVANIRIMTDLEFRNFEAHGEKVRFIKYDTGLTHDFVKIISGFMSLEGDMSDILVVYNPLFPFVSVDKISTGYRSMKEGLCGSAIGSYFNVMGLNDRTQASHYDNGIFSVISCSKTLDSGTRLNTPVDVIGLNAIDLVSLRSQDDADLFDLISNSGML